MLADDHNEFAVALYRQLGRTPGNLLFSPFSIRAALAMAYAGARGETAAQMARVLGFPAAAGTPDTVVAAIMQRLGATAGDRHEFVIANSLWAQDGAPLRDDFLAFVGEHYGAEPELVDFVSRPADAAEAINAWVADRTQGRIADFIREQPPTTRAVLVNTVYFKGTWALLFQEDETCEEPFYLDGGGEVPVPLMQERIDVRHLQDEGFQAVELTYRGDALSLLVLLPDKKDGLPDLEARLSARMLRDRVAAMTVREVDVFLPRFELGSALDLEARLSDLGMPLPFTLAADFSGMNGRTPPHRDALHISAVRHQAVVEVNEEGTEAAAATAVTMVMLGGLRTTATPTPVFRADHPFLFAIRDRKSGALLFLGRVVDPTLR